MGDVFHPQALVRRALTITGSLACLTLPAQTGEPGAALLCSAHVLKILSGMGKAASPAVSGRFTQIV